VQHSGQFQIMQEVGRRQNLSGDVLARHRGANDAVVGRVLRPGSAGQAQVVSVFAVPFDRSIERLLADKLGIGNRFRGVV